MLQSGTLRVWYKCIALTSRQLPAWVYVTSHVLSVHSVLLVSFINVAGVMLNKVQLLTPHHLQQGPKCVYELYAIVWQFGCCQHQSDNAASSMVRRCLLAREPQHVVGMYIHLYARHE